MMHLKYPRKPGFLHWDEIGCIARALGFHENLFVNNLPSDLVDGRDGVSIEEFINMFDFHKYFHGPLDRSSNNHTDDWNIHNIKKAVMYLDQHVFSFEEIQDIRRAFDAYESSDTRGMRVDEKTVQRAIKMCGRMISPQKMMHRIKHMAPRCQEPDRIQLHEFMELLLWCEAYREVTVKAEDLNVSKDNRNLFELETFEELLSHYDQKLAEDLNDQYKKDERRYVKEKFSNKKMPKDVPPVDQEIRKRQVQFHKGRYRGLHTELGQSTTRVYNSRAGYVRDRPLTAPNLTMYRTKHVGTPDSRPQSGRTSVMDMFHNIIRPKSGGPCARSAWTPSRPPTAERKQRLAMVVQPSDVAETERKIGCLQYDMETLDRKYAEILEEELDFLVPGLREKLANRPKPAPPPPPSPPPKEPSPSEETLRRLSAPSKPGKPSPCHAKSCDARFRGWHKLSKSRGHQYVLASPTFDSSPNGRLLLKMQQNVSYESKRSPLIHRYQPRKQSLRSQHKQKNQSLPKRPHTSPTITVNTALQTAKHDEDVTDDVSVTTQGQIMKATNSPDSRKATDVSDAPDAGKLNKAVEGLNKLKLLEDIVDTQNDKQEPSELHTDRHDDIKEQLRLLIIEGGDTQESNLTEGQLTSHDDSHWTRPGINLYQSSSRESTETETSFWDVPCHSTVRDSSSKEYVDSWFTKSPNVKSYHWVTDIMHTDYSHRQREKQLAFDYRRLMHRGVPDISTDLREKFRRGIAAV